jgi:hypothetical protein
VIVTVHDLGGSTRDAAAYLAPEVEQARRRPDEIARQRSHRSDALHPHTLLVAAALGLLVIAVERVHRDGVAGPHQARSLLGDTRIGRVRIADDHRDASTRRAHERFASLLDRRMDQASQSTKSAGER